MDFEPYSLPLPRISKAVDNNSNKTYAKGTEQIRKLETSPDRDEHKLKPRPKPPDSAGDASGRFNLSLKQTWGTMQELNNGVGSDVMLEISTQANQENMPTSRETVSNMTPILEHGFRGNIYGDTVN